MLLAPSPDGANESNSLRPRVLLYVYFSVLNSPRNKWPAPLVYTLPFINGSDHQSLSDILDSLII